MCSGREGVDFPPYEEWNRNGAVAGSAPADPVPGPDVAGGLGVQERLVDVCECGGDPDGFRHTMSLLHMTMVNRKRDMIEDWRERTGWLRQRRMMEHR